MPLLYNYMCVYFMCTTAPVLYCTYNHMVAIQCVLTTNRKPYMYEEHNEPWPGSYVKVKHSIKQHVYRLFWTRLA